LAVIAVKCTRALSRRSSTLPQAKLSQAKLSQAKLSQAKSRYGWS
jgi:hypothetical protein